MKLTCLFALVLLLAGCNGESAGAGDANDLADAHDGSGGETDVHPSQWTHERLMAGAHIYRSDDTNGITIGYFEGNHYQMGYQHGFLLREGITEFRNSLLADDVWRMVMHHALDSGPDPENNSPTYAELSLTRSHDFILEECQGITAGSEGAISVEECTVLNSVLWMFEDLMTVHLPFARDLYGGCSQFAAANDATADGKLVHGRNMDWVPMEGIMQNSLVLVRKPEGKLRFVTMAWPALIANFTGMNESGLVVAINDHLCKEDAYDVDGIPPLQTLTKVLLEATNLDEALEVAAGDPASSCGHFFFSHGPSRDSLVIETTPAAIAIRHMEDGVVFATNHFIEPETIDEQDFGDIEDMNINSVTRFTRLQERLTGESKPPHNDLSPNAPDYAHGRLDVEMAIEIMRDPVDLRPEQGRACFACNEFGWDSSNSVGNNHCMTSYIFVPEDLRFWMAAGWDEECDNPAYNPFIGFDLNELFEGTYTAGRVPNYDPDYNCPTNDDY